MKPCEIRGDVPESQYFQHAYRGYGRYQWSIKYYGWHSNDEIEVALLWAFGEHIRLGPGNREGFTGINSLLGRDVEATIDGRSGGWFVINDELTDKELETVDAHITLIMRDLPEFLREERERLKEDC